MWYYHIMTSCMYLYIFIITTVNLSQSFSCMMELPAAVEPIAKYFVIFTSSVDLMSKLAKNTSRSICVTLACKHPSCLHLKFDSVL